jgi:hypothetical protein
MLWSVDNSPALVGDTQCMGQCVCAGGVSGNVYAAEMHTRRRAARATGRSAAIKDASGGPASECLRKRRKEGIEYRINVKQK